MKSLRNKIKKLSTSPGVYIFKDAKGMILYIGKAASLRDRVGSYFNGRNEFARPIDFAIEQIANVEIKQVDSVLEAYFLEQELIKKYQPKYNVLGKDDKSFVYVCLTEDEFPRFEVRRKTDISKLKTQDRQKSTYLPRRPASQRGEQAGYSLITTHYKKIYGPYTSRHLIEEALKILRRIFPYHNRKQKTEKGCLDAHIGLCPAPYDGKISKREYMKNIRAIEMILKGKKKSLVSRLEKQMHQAAMRQEFEGAAKLRNMIFALRHIHDVALISEDKIENQKSKIKNYRIEGYDISNISGKHTTGSMVVFDNSEGELRSNKKEYRKFQIRTISEPNDVGAMEEVLRRRFKNSWKLPNLIVIDGGKGHLNVARKVLRENHFNIPLMAVAKGPTRKRLDIYCYGKIPNIPKGILEQVRDEAHRFAINYHRKLRGKSAMLYI